MTHWNEKKRTDKGKVETGKDRNGTEQGAMKGRKVIKYRKIKRKEEKQ